MRRLRHTEQRRGVDELRPNGSRTSSLQLTGLLADSAWAAAAAGAKIRQVLLQVIASSEFLSSGIVNKAWLLTNSTINAGIRALITAVQTPLVHAEQNTWAPETKTTAGNILEAIEDGGFPWLRLLGGTNSISSLS